MKICFLSGNIDENVGSYRIWVKDLNKSLQELGHNSVISNSGAKFSKDEANDFDIVILCKSAYSVAPEARKIFKRSKIGAINIPSNHYDSNIDFVIVGSVEEYISMSKYRNVFIYPLIERKFENVEIKKHEETSVMKFCFHGHWPHIPKFFPYLSSALDGYHSNVKPSELHIITGEDESPYGEKFIPSKVPVFFHNYAKISFTELVKKFDIGLVPNVTPIENISPEVVAYNNSQLGLYETDFNIRLKNKTNAGRSYVFYQHGLPVIHDLSPSSFDFMSRTGIYCCGHDTDSYLREMIRLTDFSFRNKVAVENQKAFKRDFNPISHAEKLVNFIKEV